jgi:hypothetical protein
VVIICGSNWPAGDSIELSWDFNWSVPVVTVQADGSGAFTAIITVPAGAPTGTNYIDAGDQAAFLTGQALFTVVSQSVTPSPPPPPSDAPRKTIDLVAWIRDFCGIGFDASTCPTGYKPHSDFEGAVISDDRGLVNATLGDDRTPVPNGSFPTATVQSGQR